MNPSRPEHSRNRQGGGARASWTPYVRDAAPCCLELSSQKSYLQKSAIPLLMLLSLHSWRIRTPAEWRNRKTLPLHLSPAPGGEGSRSITGENFLGPISPKRQAATKRGILTGSANLNGGRGNQPAHGEVLPARRPGVSNNRVRCSPHCARRAAMRCPLGLLVPLYHRAASIQRINAMWPGRPGMI